MRLPGATYFIRNNPFRGGKGKQSGEEERWRRALWLADLHRHWQILINALGGARRNTMPCNHFIMTNRNSNAVPCEPSRGKIELTVNCSCLGNGEEEKKKGGQGEEDRQRVSRRRERREKVFWPTSVLAGLLLSWGLRRFIEELWFQQLLANDANSEIQYRHTRALHDLAVQKTHYTLVNWDVDALKCPRERTIKNNHTHLRTHVQTHSDYKYRCL